MNGSFVEGVQGDWAGVAAIEVRAIPRYSLISQNETEAGEMIRNRFSSFLTEIGQRFQNWNENGTAAVCVNSLWISRPASGQINAASISIYLIFHALASSKHEAADVLNQCVSSAKHVLSSMYFEFREVSYDDYLKTQIAAVSSKACVALTRVPKNVPVGSQFLPSCFSYDRFPLAAAHFDSLMRAMGNHPGVMVSLQIVPTRLSDEEYMVIAQYAQMLAAIAGGPQPFDNDVVALPSAIAPAENYAYYLNNADSALYTHAFFLFGLPDVVADIAATLSIAIGYGDDKQTSLSSFWLNEAKTMKDDNFHFMPWAAGEMVESLYADNLRFSGLLDESSFDACVWLPGVVTAEEASGFMCLPAGNDAMTSLCQVLESASIAHGFREGVLDSSDIPVGFLKSSPDQMIGFNLNDLTRHMLVVGTPGSGKTTFSVGLLDRLWKEHGIPFLVIEPAKNEYRAIVQSIPDLQVFTPGKSNISPFVINPFVPPQGVRLETYKATLLTVFSAGASMESPLDRLFERAVDECYSRHGWLDSFTVDDGGEIFNIDDFVLAFRRVMEKVGYVGDASNIVRAGLVRLQRMRRLFDTYHTIPVQDLLSKPTVIELAAIENSDEKALLIALVLLLMQTYVTSNYVGKGKLRNIVLLEEAHVLLGEAAGTPVSAAQPSAIAQGLLKRMLAEIRSAGVGIVIADQSPRKVTQDIVGLTDIKLAFRLVELEDRSVIADAITMDASQRDRLASLQVGEGFLFYQKLDYPEEVITPDYRLDNKIDITLDDESIAALSTYWKSRAELLKPYPPCASSKSCASGCSLPCRELAASCARIIFEEQYEGFDEAQDVTSRMVLDSVKRHLETSERTKRMLAAKGFSRGQLGNCIQIHLLRLIRYEARRRIL